MILFGTLLTPNTLLKTLCTGPSAVHGMLEVPPMPLGDGTYYQPGGFYAVGTVYSDAKGEPIYRIGAARGMSNFIFKIHDLAEWRENRSPGGDALTTRGAQRPNARL